MKKKEVPQDEGLTEGLFEDICYAVDENGKYSVVPTSGWQPKTDALLQAWELIHEKVEAVRQKVIQGELSPIAYYMEKNLMAVGMLAKYLDLPKRKVRKHLKPSRYLELDEETLSKYADIFGITLETLRDQREIKKTE